LLHVVSIAEPKFLVVGSEHAAKVAAIAGDLSVPAERILVINDRGASGPAPIGVSFDEARSSASGANPPSTEEQAISQRCVYIYTSGTTGLPKAAAMTNGRFLKAASLFSKAVMGLSADDVVYGSGLPLYHSSGLILGWGSSIVA